MSDNMMQECDTTETIEAVGRKRKSVMEFGSSSKSLWMGYKLQPITMSSEAILQRCASRNAIQDRQQIPESIHGRFSRNVLGTNPMPRLKPLEAADLTKSLPITPETTRLNNSGKSDIIGKSSVSSVVSKKFGIFKMFKSLPALSCNYNSDPNRQSPQNLLFDSNNRHARKTVASSVDHVVHFKSVSLKSHFLQPTSLSADMMPSNPNKEKQRSTVISFSPSDQPIDQNHENELVNMGTERSSSDKTLSLENKESDILRTELLDLEGLHQVEESENFISKLPLCNVIKDEPSSRWVKRLWMQSIDSYALGTKSLKLDETSDGRRVYKLFTRVLNYSRSNSDVTFHRRLEQHQNGKSTMSFNDEDTYMELLKKSHSWIRRWCRHEHERGCSSTRSEAQLSFEGNKNHATNQSQKGDVSREYSEPKQFPSIGAMALMGKAVSNFRPCEFRRKGPSIVWIT